MKTLIDMRTNHLARFYSALERLESDVGGKRRLSHCDGRMDWPKRGVYFFFENGELRNSSGDGPRVVRVGTHAVTLGSKTSLWNRLSTHRGSARTGGGNHRGSIFRKLVGYALMIRHPECTIETWGEGDSAPADIRAAEFELEQGASAVIGKMPLLWLGVDDPPDPQSQRGYIERNAIALLSSYGKNAIDPPSENWLGNHSPREKVKLSGLWNQRHVEEDYDPGFLSVFEDFISRQIKKGC